MERDNNIRRARRKARVERRYDSLFLDLKWKESRRLPNTQKTIRSLGIHIYTFLSRSIEGVEVLKASECGACSRSPVRAVPKLATGGEARMIDRDGGARSRECK